MSHHIFQVDYQVVISVDLPEFTVDHVEVFVREIVRYLQEKYWEVEDLKLAKDCTHSFCAKGQKLPNLSAPPRRCWVGNAASSVCAVG